MRIGPLKPPRKGGVQVLGRLQPARGLGRRMGSTLMDIRLKVDVTVRVPLAPVFVIILLLVRIF